MGRYSALLHLTILGCAFLVARPAAAADYGANNVTPNELHSTIRRITIDTAGVPVPVLDVWHNGESYDRLSVDAQVLFGFDYDVECRGATKIHDLSLWVNDNARSSPIAYFQKHHPIWTKPVISSMSKVSSTGGAAWLGGPVPAPLAAAAVSACNAHVEARIAVGKTRAQALAEDRTLGWAEVTPALSGVVKTQCSNDGQMDHHAYQNLRISYRCHGASGGAPQPGLPGAGGVAAPGLIQRVTATATPSEYEGICPTTVFFEGAVETTKTKFPLQLRWSHQGALGPIKTMATDSQRIARATLTLHVGPAPVPAQTRDDAPDIKAAPAKGGGPNQPPAHGYANNDSDTAGWMKLLALPQGASDWTKAAASAPVTYRVTCRPDDSASKPDRAAPKPGRSPTQPDLVPGDAISIGAKTTLWGGSLAVSPEDASERQGGRCRFRLAFAVANVGTAAAGASVATLRASGSLLHEAAVPVLATGKLARLDTVVSLTDGEYLVVLDTDSGRTVSEEDEGNNAAKLRLWVSGCAAE